MATNNFIGIDNGDKWDSQTISYTYDVPASSNAYHFNADQIAATEAVIAQMQNITNLNFVYVETPDIDNQADFFFVTDNLGGSVVGRVSNFPSDADQIYIYLDDQVDTTDLDDVQRSLTPGYGGFKTTLHELGHALGLKHPHHGARARDDDEFTYLNDNEDNNNTTVMSYGDSDDDSVGGQIANAHDGPTAPQSYMLYDIALLQQKYGANTDYNSDDDTYLFDGSTKVYTIWDGAGNDTLDATGESSDITIDLREGLENVSSISATHFWIAFNADIENAIGGSGDDTITGNDLDNILTGAEGADSILGGSGNDTINGGTGNDTLAGQDDADSILGGSRNDSLTGGNGADFLDGEEGDDDLFGGADDDTLQGGTGADTLNGGSGNDTLFGGTGDDSLNGGAGDDDIDGEDGEDTISGGTGNDSLTGGLLADTFIITALASMNDTIADFTATEDIIDLTNFSEVYSLSDIAIAQDGDDSVLTFADAQTLTLQDFDIADISEDDLLLNAEPDPTPTPTPTPTPSPTPSPAPAPTTPAPQQPEGAAATIAVTLGSDKGDQINAEITGGRIKGLGGNDTLNGNQGDDFINGNQGNDTITGGAGNDSLRGGKDQDTLDAGAGNDHVNGNLGNDIIYGASGNNTLHGGKDDDIIYGGSDDDLIKGDFGNDQLFGRAGNDTIYGRDGADTLTGDAGQDIFAFQLTSDSTALSSDIITDFSQGVDKIDLSALGISNVDELRSSSSAGNTSIQHQNSDFEFTLLGTHNLVASDFIFSA